jgi:hypothetical protein
MCVHEPFPEVSQNCRRLSLLQVFVLSLSFSAVAAADSGTPNLALARIDTTTTIGTWSALKSTITASAGTKATLTLEAKFDMTGFKLRSEITLSAANTDITLVGNGAVFNGGLSNADDDGHLGGKHDHFFTVGSGNGNGNVKLVMSNVTLHNGAGHGMGGAIRVGAGGTIILTSCTLSANYADYGAPSGANGSGEGGAIYVDTGGTISLTSCTLSANYAGYDGIGGAIYFTGSSTGLLTNCAFNGPVSPYSNDIARADGTASVTFACGDGEVGTPVQMQGNEITVIPPKELQCTKMYYCPNGGTQGCVPCDFTGCKGIKNQTECNSIFPGGCPKRPHWD